MKKKIIALGLILAMSFALTACDKATEEAVDDAAQDVVDSITDAVDDLTGDSGSAGDSVDMSTATEQTWGVFTISVPAGFEFKTGYSLDETDKECCSVKESTFKYFDISRADKEQGMSTYNYNKENYTNEQKDVSGQIGDFNWTGFQYSDGFGGYGFELYTEVGDKVVRISSAGYEFGSAVPEAVLATLHVKE